MSESNVRYYVYVDANGNEINRKPVSRGRPPKGAVKQEDGNYRVPPKQSTIKTVE